MFEDIDEGLLGGQNLLVGTSNGNLYKNANGEQFEKSGSLSNQVYIFNDGIFDLKDIISIQSCYTLSFLLHIPNNEQSRFNMSAVKVKFYNEITESDQTQIIDMEMSTTYNTNNTDFKFVKFTIDTSLTDLEVPISISIYTVDKSPLVIADLKLEFGKVATAWCKSIDDAMVSLPDGLLENILNKPKYGSLVIPTTGWEDYTEDPLGYFVKYIDIPCEDVTSNHILNGTVKFSDNDIAAECDMALKIETFNKKVRFFAHEIPSAEIHIDYIIILAKYNQEDGGVIIIPTEGWIDSGEEYYEKKLVLPYTGISENDYIIGTASFKTNDIAAEAEIASVETGDGTITFVARKVPTEPIEFEYNIIEGEKKKEEEEVVDGEQ